jgi:hypothetical protein
MVICGLERGPRPPLSFTIGTTAHVVPVEVVDKVLYVLSTKKAAVPEGSTWLLMPFGHKVWCQELGCEIQPTLGKRFYLSTHTQDPHHLLMEW